jgi:tetrahydrodipicolinate N-succinyltransferase
MTNEEMQKTMQFILEQQAQFTVNIQKLQEAQGKTDEKVAQLEGLVTRLAAATLEGFKDVNAKINALADAQIRTEENLSKTNEEMRNLIAVVDRYFSEGRNGKQSQ